MAKRPINIDDENNLVSNSSKVARKSTSTKTSCDRSSSTSLHGTSVQTSCLKLTLLPVDEMTINEDKSNYEFPVLGSECLKNGETFKKLENFNIRQSRNSTPKMSADIIQQYTHKISDETGVQDTNKAGNSSKSIASGGISPSNSLSSHCTSLIDDFFELNEEEKKLHRAMSVVREVLPVEYRGILEEIVQSTGFLTLLKNVFVHSSNAFLSSTGRDSTQNQSSKDLINKLKSFDFKLLSCYLGATMVKDFMDHPRGLDFKNKQDDYEKEQKATTQQEVSPGSISNSETSPQVVAGERMDVFCAKPGTSLLITENDDSLTCIPVPNHDSSHDDSGTSSECQKLAITNINWEEASDFPSTMEQNEKIRNVGKKLFMAVFSKREILECTCKGSKNKKAFDGQKVRFIKRGVAWLLTEPKIKTQTEFDLYVKNMDPRLTKQDEAFLITKVFTEYAYCQRSKLNKAKSQEID